MVPTSLITPKTNPESHVPRELLAGQLAILLSSPEQLTYIKNVLDVARILAGPNSDSRKRGSRMEGTMQGQIQSLEWELSQEAEEYESLFPD